eukprot:1152064-Pelagomonas_calceolata.AAC.5
MGQLDMPSSVLRCQSSPRGGKNPKVSFTLSYCMHCMHHGCFLKVYRNTFILRLQAMTFTRGGYLRPEIA